MSYAANGQADKAAEQLKAGDSWRGTKDGYVFTTGWGEPIMKVVLAKWAADRVATGSMPEWVAKEAISHLEDRVHGHGGIILLDAKGRVGIAHNTPRMAWAVRKADRQEHGITVGCDTAPAP